MNFNPEHTRPFNLEHARAGAPIVGRNGLTATFIAYVPDALEGERVIAQVKDRIAINYDDGRNHQHSETDFDLFMAPLGYIHGKPVFVGDDIELKCQAKPDEWKRVKAEPTWAGTWTDDCARWPAPEREYPKFTQKDIDTIKGWSGKNWQVDFANAALRHAIDSGQVVIPDPERDMKIAMAVANYCDGRLFAEELESIIKEATK